ncbi:MAG: 4-hydroxy-3-methylbut-2-enyl diphosphate reductase [Marinilabiliales bacterium]|nr:MAG: 4-hydroxy-3-methylbut-2-enyl diphosphate reductase [Marinilabiliales bacterium]
MMNVIIDKDAGFCFGVRNSISVAEELVAKGENIKCLGQIVHNDKEVSRLRALGVEFVSFEEYKNLKNETVLLRAHGEIPETYEIAKQNNLKIIDTTCPIVSSLQKKVLCSWEELSERGGQIVIYGQKEHPEVKGLKAQAGGEAIIVNDINEIFKIDFTKDIHLFSQTTKNKKSFENIIRSIKIEADKNSVQLYSNSSICRQVVNREVSIINMAKTNDVVIFVAGKNSSNGKTLFEICKSVNEKSHYISSVDELETNWFKGIDNVVVTGSTSSPLWLLEDIKEEILRICI